MQVDVNSIYEHPRASPTRINSAMSFEDVNMSPSPDSPEEEEGYPRFKSSKLNQQTDLRTYLDMKICEPYNHFCINCKRRKSSHFLLWLGAFVCKHCANAIKVRCGGNKNCYSKDVFNEQWDDYQLRSVAHGGNQNLFKILQEYELETQNLVDTYNEPILQWYRKQQIAKMDRVLFTEPKPKRNWIEKFEEAQDSLVNKLNNKYEEVESADWKGTINEKQEQLVTVLNTRFNKASEIIGGWLKFEE